MSQLPKTDGTEMVSMLARCLPHIVPHVLLAKREVSNSIIGCIWKQRIQEHFLNQDFLYDRQPISF